MIERRVLTISAGHPYLTALYCSFQTEVSQPFSHFCLFYNLKCAFFLILQKVIREDVTCHLPVVVIIIIIIIIIINYYKLLLLLLLLLLFHL